ncbi:MAG: PTS sugar transporter subunit IIA [Myxococcaceae bacterium]
MKLAEFLTSKAVQPELVATTKSDVLRELAALVAAATPAIDPERVLSVLQDRERLGSTGIGEGVAIPHGKLAGLPGMVAAFGVSRSGVDFEALDGKPTQLFFVLVAPENCAGLHLKALARVSRMFKQSSFRERMLGQSDVDAIFQQLVAEDN